MVLEEEQETQNENKETKIKTSISLSPYLYEWVTQLVRRRVFASNSDVIGTALSELKGRMDAKEEKETLKLEIIEKNNTEYETKYKKIEDGYVTFIFKIFSQYPELLHTNPELINELNELIYEHPKNKDTLKKVIFE